MRTSSAPAAHEVVVLGGGPAGASAAALLATWGHDVALLTRRTPPAPGLAESVPPSAARLLELVGVRERVERAGLHANGGNTVWWAKGRERKETFGNGAAAGFQVERAALEALFHAHAQDAGVRMVMDPARLVRRHSALASRSTDTVYRPGDGGAAAPVAADATAFPWEIRTASSRILRARWVLDATGRTGLLARPDLREPDRSTRTVALVRRWSLTGLDPHATLTLVESYADGWAWSVPLSATERCVTAMVDPRLTGFERGSAIDALYAAELAKTTHLSKVLEGARAMGDPWACPASPYGASAFGGQGFVLVGDAGSFIDPLSSYGIKKALASAWLSAVTAHTALRDPAMEEDARAFHDRRERSVYRSYRRLSAPFFGDAARAHGHPYWERRAEAAAAAGGSAPTADPAERLTAAEDDEGLPPRAEVEAAWQTLRRGDRLDAAESATLHTVLRPVLADRRIVLAEHLASDRCPDGLRWVRGVALPDLVRAAPDSATVPDLYERMASRRPDLTLPAFLTALSTAFAAGFLTHGS